MRKISLLLLFALAFAGPAAAALMVGYSIDNHTGIVSTFRCWEYANPECFSNRIELGIIAGLNPWVTTMAPTGEFVVWDEANEELVWVEVPSLDILSRLAVDVGLTRHVSGIAFDQNGDLWLAAMGPELYTIDQVTGQATLIRDSGSDIELIAFVGDRLFAAHYRRLLEIDPASGSEREVADYSGVGGGLLVTQLTSHVGGLWSLASMSYPVPWTYVELGKHDLETGVRTVVQASFAYSLISEDWYWTLALVDSQEQLPSAVPVFGLTGLLTLIVLTCIGGWLLLRRRV